MLQLIILPAFSAAALVLYLLSRKYNELRSWRTATLSVIAIICGVIVPDGSWTYLNFSFSDLLQCYLFLFGFYMYVKSLREFYEYKSWRNIDKYLLILLSVVTPLFLHGDPGYQTRAAVIAIYQLVFSVFGGIVVYEKWARKFLVGSILFMVFALGNSISAIPRIFFPFSIYSEPLKTAYLETAFLVWSGAAIVVFCAGHLINGFSWLMGLNKPDRILNSTAQWSLSQADCALVLPNGALTNLSMSEFRVLELLLHKAPEPVARADLIIAMTGQSDDKQFYSRTLEVLISRIRSRTKAKGEDLPVKSMRNVGYVFHGRSKANT